MALRNRPDAESSNPGHRLKALRLERGWTLADTAERTSLPISTLSRLENGKMAMTYEKLLQISGGLGIDMSVLVGGAAAPTSRLEGGYRRAIVRAGEGRLVETPTGDYRYVATDLLRKVVTPIVGDVFARSIDDYEDYLRHAGEEYLFVLSGTLDLYTEAYAPTRLEIGDSIYFDSGMGHAYIAVGEQPCRVLSICANVGGDALEHHQIAPLGATAPNTADFDQRAWNRSRSAASSTNSPSGRPSKAAAGTPRRKR